MAREGPGWTFCASIMMVICSCACDGRVLSNRGALQLSGDTEESLTSTCRLESFYIFDGNVLAKRAKVPLCHLEMFVVSPTSGQIFLKGSPEAEEHGAVYPHYYGTYSAAWYLGQALGDSVYATRNREEAGLYYVDDYCYYMWWLAAAQTRETPKEIPAAHLLKIYEELLKTEEWNKREGVDFVFLLPYRLQQVAEYQTALGERNTLHTFLDLFCHAMHLSLQMTVENMQGRSMCGAWERKQLIVPFVPNVIETGGTLTESLEGMNRQINSLKSRTTLVYFQGRCAHHKQLNPSRMLRGQIFEALEGQGQDVHAVCTEREGSSRSSFEELLKGMEKSVFCLVLPEWGQSARVLSEVMTAGCIPVFIGPPFASMPFFENLDYAEFGITILLTNHEAWTAEDQGLFHHKVAEEESKESESLDSAEGLTFFAEVESPAAILPLLRSLPQNVLEKKLEEVRRVRKSFRFAPELDVENPSAVDVLTLDLCRYMNLIDDQNGR